MRPRRTRHSNLGILSISLRWNLLQLEICYDYVLPLKKLNIINIMMIISAGSLPHPFLCRPGGLANSVCCARPQRTRLRQFPPGPILSVFFALIVHSELKSVHPGFPLAFIF